MPLFFSSLFITHRNTNLSISIVLCPLRKRGIKWQEKGKIIVNLRESRSKHNFWPWPSWWILCCLFVKLNEKKRSLVWEHTTTFPTDNLFLAISPPPGSVWVCITVCFWTNGLHISDVRRPTFGVFARAAPPVAFSLFSSYAPAVRLQMIDSGITFRRRRSRADPLNHSQSWQARSRMVVQSAHTQWEWEGQHHSSSNTCN